MERQCHHCNAPVPEGAPFCAACGAPQIRVVAPQSTTPPPLPSTDATPPPLPGQPAFALNRVVWGSAVKKCLIAAATLIVVLTLVKSTGLLFLAVPAAGWFAAFLYSRELPITGGIGARIGAVTGLIAFGVNVALMGVSLLIARGQMMEEIKRVLNEATAKNPDPQVQQMVQKLMTPEGIAILLTLGVVIMLFLFLILASIGGAIGGATARGRSTS